MKRILTTTAIAALTAMPLHAEQHAANTNEASMQVSVGDQEFRASNMMGAKVYMPGEGEGQDVAGMEVSEVPDSWTEIGSVEDVFVGNGGEIATVVFSPNDEISSDKDRVGLKTASVEFKKDSDGNEIYVVYTGDKVTLEESEEFDQASAEQSGQKSAADMQKQQASAEDQNKQSGDKQMQQAANAETQKDGLTIRAADLTGHTVYVPTTEEEAEGISAEMAEVPDNWEQVGDVGSVVLTREGEIKSITLDAGGFLGVDEKEIETQMEDLRFVRDADADADNEFYIVYTGDRSKLEDSEEFNRTQAEAEGNQVMTSEDADQAANLAPKDEPQAAGDEQDRDMASNEDGMKKEDGESLQSAANEDGKSEDAQDEQTASNEDGMNEDAEDEQMAANEDGMNDNADEQQTAQNDMSEDGSQDEQMADAGAQETEGTGPMTNEQMAQLTADELEGQTVIGSEGDNIGDVSTLVLDDSGEIDKVIVDVGGFLGIGEKPVALPFDDLQIEQTGEGMGAIEVTTDHTQEELENMESWDEV
ncbi:hypothetical protein GQE99_16000 [Maritimibacter sp. DP07]|uniref:PRC-barrel domain-containing protein n=1 Tax=Maritimibacter harenae TaxID=2606218 RepID=A0A845M9N8_9RHOB|nr:PRC-barrel domain-containing protein [Maritimibacter harenae]MZR14523.1 hypothetical protein [Maritimibacter harenae]